MMVELFGNRATRAMKPKAALKSPNVKVASRPSTSLQPWSRASARERASLEAFAPCQTSQADNDVGLVPLSSTGAQMTT